MANLIRFCGHLGSTNLNSLVNWKSCNVALKIPFSKFKISNNCNQFTKWKISSKKNLPQTVYFKISIGIATGLAIKISKNHIVFCKADSSTRLAGLESVAFVKEPNFKWKKFLKLLLPYWPELIGAVMAAIVCALLNIQIPRALGSLVDVLIKLTNEGKDFWDEMKTPIIKIITYYSLQSLFTFLYIAFLSKVGEGVAKTMKMNLFSSILNQDIVFFDQIRTGEIINRLTADVQDFKSSFKTIISQGLKSVTQILGCTVSLYYISPTMTGVMIIVVPSVVLIGTITGSLLRQLSYKAKSQGAKVTLVAEEAISNIRTVRSFGMEKLEQKIIDEQTEIHKKLNIKLGYGIAIFQAGANLFLNGIVLGTIYLGGYMMTTGSISPGDLMAFLVAAQILQRSFAQISVLFGSYIKGKHAAALVFEMTDLPTGKTLSEGKIIPHHSFIPNVNFENVVFKYPTRPEKEVLKSINLNIKEGKTIAIVGSSGSGKSTLAWLLERFYDIETGSIYIGGENIKNLSSTWLRKKVIGFISQEPVLFATTVMENIRYGEPEATDEEVIAAAKLANADNFIREFPEGYQTLVGERGVSVSGGQKQRIAIARALLKKPYILILDEATSALDAESEKAVQQALESVTKFTTTIIIAHRLSTIKNADLIIVLNNGVIIEAGTHRELLQKKGMYAALVAQQVQDG